MPTVQPSQPRTTKVTSVVPVAEAGDAIPMPVASTAADAKVARTVMFMSTPVGLMSCQYVSDCYSGGQDG